MKLIVLCCLFLSSISTVHSLPDHCANPSSHTNIFSLKPLCTVMSAIKNVAVVGVSGAGYTIITDRV